MIKVLYPFELKSIYSISEYLFILKNCLRLIQKHGLFKKIDGQYVFLKWSHDKSNWIIELVNNSKIRSIHCTRKDINSLLNNKRLYEASCFSFDVFHDNSNISSLLKKYHIFKNENRLVNFIYLDNVLYPVGLYNKNINNYVLLDNNSIIKDLVSCDYRFRSTKLQLNIKNYLNEYSNFLEELNSTPISANSDKDLMISMYLDLKKKSHDKKLSYKKYTALIKERSMPNEKEIFYYMLYTITISFNKFLNKKLEACHNLIFYDKLNQHAIKLPHEFYVVKEKKSELDYPLMPARY